MTNWLRRLPIAHRGLHDEGRGLIENSRSAFAAAAEAGYAIELDVHPSRDGEAIVFHDATLERLTDQRGPIGALNAGDLGEIFLRGSQDKIPALSTVLDLVGGRVPLLIEIKSGARPVGPLEQRVAALLRAYPGEAAIQSFDPAVIAWFHGNTPGIPRGLLAGRMADLLTPPIFASQFIAYDVRALPALGPWVARRMGLPVIAWTIRDDYSRDIGAAHADNIIFEGFNPRLP